MALTNKEILELRERYGIIPENTESKQRGAYKSFQDYEGLKQQYVELKAQGKKNEEICDELDIPLSTLMWIKKNKWGINSNWRELDTSPEALEDLLNQYLKLESEGLPDWKIAEVLGMSRPSLSYRRKYKWGLPPKKKGRKKKNETISN